jgi:hypothetical protein
MYFKHLQGQHDQRKHGRKGPGSGGSTNLPSWKNLPRVDPNDPLVKRVTSQRLSAPMHVIREETYDKYLEAVKDLQLPDKGQFFDDGTYIPSKRAIDIVRAMQQGIKPNGVLAMLPRNAPKWDVEQLTALPDFPEGFTPFTKNQAKSIELPNLLRLKSNSPLQELFAEMGIDVKTKPVGKKYEKQWRDTLDRLGRFISPVDTNGNSTKITDENEIVVIPSPTKDAWWSNKDDAWSSSSKSVIKTYSSMGAMAHELLHEIQFRNPTMNKRVTDFFTRRTDGYNSVDANNLSSDERFDGDAVTDLFSQAYMGRVYPGFFSGKGTSEIITTFVDSLELMNSDVNQKIDLLISQNYTDTANRMLRYRDMIKDTEHISFVIDLLSDPDSFGTPANP